MVATTDQSQCVHFISLPSTAGSEAAHVKYAYPLEDRSHQSSVAIAMAYWEKKFLIMFYTAPCMILYYLHAGDVVRLQS